MQEVTYTSTEIGIQHSDWESTPEAPQPNPYGLELAKRTYRAITTAKMAAFKVPGETGAHLLAALNEAEKLVFDISRYAWQEGWEAGLKAAQDDLLF